MGVQLREKQMKSGQISFYLDIYHNKHRWYEFLDIHINKSKPTEADKDKKRMAVEIRANGKMS
jgi:Arm domain-containing DNA-binding protein